MFLLHCRLCNLVTEANYIPLTKSEEAIKLVATALFWSKIDLLDRYYNGCIEKESKKYNAFLIHLEYLYS